MTRHRWTGNVCRMCHLHREAAGEGAYGAMRYYYDGVVGYMYKTAGCPLVPQVYCSHCARVHSDTAACQVSQ
jgi:hypothetical protein